MPKDDAEGAGKRVPVMTRVTAPLRERLDQVAAASGRSLGQEVERRVEQSFEWEQFFGGETFDLLKLIAGTVDYVMAHDKQSWRDSKETRDNILRNIQTLFDAMEDKDGFASSRAAYEQRAAYERRVSGGDPEAERPSVQAPAPIAVVDLDALAERAAEKAIERVFAKLLPGGMLNDPNLEILHRDDPRAVEAMRKHEDFKTSRAARKAEAKAKQRDTNLTAEDDPKP
jgi:hypothetical protein